MTIRAALVALFITAALLVSGAAFASDPISLRCDLKTLSALDPLRKG